MGVNADFATVNLLVKLLHSVKTRGSGAIPKWGIPGAIERVFFQVSCLVGDIWVTQDVLG